MSKGFFSNLSLLFILNILVKPIWLFGVERSVQNTLGEATYGLYFAMFNLTLVFNIFLELGINSFNNRSIAQQPTKINSYLPNLLFLKAIASIGFATLIFLVGLALGYKNQQLLLLGLCSLNLMVVSLILFLRTNISGLQYFKIDGVFSVLDRSLMIVFVGLLLWLPPTKNSFNVFWFVGAQIAANILVALTAFFFVLSKVKFPIFKIDFSIAKVLLTKALPFALLSFLMAIYYRIDGIMLERLLKIDGAEQSGIYAAAYRLLDAANMAGYLFATILLPLFSKLLADKVEIGSLLKFSANLLIVLVLSLSIPVYVFASPIMNLLYINSTPYYGYVLKILILTSIPIALVYVYGTLLVANNNLKILNYLALVGVLFNITLNCLLIYKLKAVGAGYTTLLTQWLVALIQIYFCHKFLNLEFKYIEFLKLIAFAFLGYIIANLLYITFSGSLWTFILSGVLLVSLSLFMKIISVKEIKKWTKLRAA